MFTHASRRRGFVASAILGLVAAPLAVIATTSPAQAAPSTGLVISEVYGGGGNGGATYTNDFIELYNPTSAAISVAGMSVQYRSAAGNTAQLTNLTGSVPAGGHYLVLEQAGTTVTNKPLPTPDATGNIAMGAAAGVVILASDQVGVTAQGNFAGTGNPANVIDTVGFGTTPTTFETTNTGAATSATLSAQRVAAGTDTDANAPDFSELTPTPQNSGVVATPLAATNPGNKTAAVGTAITGFTLAASGGTAPYTWTATGLPAGVTVAGNGAVSGTPTTAGTYNVTATATDSATPTAATATTSFTITVAPAPLAATNPGDKTAAVGTAITGFSLAASGGTTPYSWTATGLPAGVTVAANGAVSGTPTTAGTYNVTATVTDSATPTAATATTSFTITVSAAPSGSVDIQILATNDFHGRIQNDTTSGAAGAAVLAGAVKQLRTVNPNTVFAAAGDLIGASTFESFIAHDKPTIDALNEAGLEVSAVGNHEFDQGYDDLVNRVMKPYNEDTNPYGGARWKYLGANVKFKADDTGALDGTWVKTMNGVQVGFIGAVTEHLPELVSPGGIADIKVTDIATAANAAANQLKTDGADVVVLLVHEGAAGTDCATINADTTSDFGKITGAVNDNVDAIVSGHTHLAYNCSQTVSGWSARPVTTRPIVSAGQYGTNLNQIVYTVDNGTGVVTNKTQALLPLKNGTTGSTFNYPVDSATQTIVTTAVNNANVLGAQPLGKVGGGFYRAKLADGTTENRGGESTLGNLVAEIQRWSTTDPAFGAAQIAFMNPGGLRADLVGQGTAAFPRVVTYKDAANVQPFANTLVNEALTGAQIKAALEQQWQPTGASRPFLKLGTSKGFTYTYDPAAAQGSRVKAMYLNGTAMELGATYSVTVNSFLATGGDNFTALNGAARKQDTGRTDLQAQVDYFAALAADPAGLPVDSAQGGVGAVVTTATPTAGQDVSINLSSLSMTGPGDVKDTTVDVKLDGVTLGSFPVTSTLQTQLPGYDEVGTATAIVTLPVTASGAKTLVISGPTTGTVARVPITVAVAPSVDIQILATNDFHGRIANDTTSGAAGAAVLAGAVKQLRTVNPNTVFAAAGDLIGASTFESFIAKDKPTIDALNEAGLEVSAVGNHEFDQGYNDLVNRVMAPYDATTNPYGGASWKYLGANVKFKDSGNPALDGTWVKTMGGIKVGFIGAVTEHLPELVSPAGISTIQVTDIATAANAAAAGLKADGADVIVLLVHEGAAGTDCASITSATTGDFGKITSAVNDNIDAIVSGHTHLTYNCSQTVPGWSGRPVTTRPIVSAGQYGTNLNQINYTVNPSTGLIEAKTQALLPLKNGTTGSTFNYPVDQATQDIVNAAVANANVLGARPLGNIAGAFNRAKLQGGTTENRGGESTLGNLVAEIQRWSTSDPAFGAAQIAFMNPGGLRADLVGQGTAAYPRVVTYKDAANVQPFANTLVNEDLTGAQIKAALEQQWQPTGASRPFLKLGISKGFTYTYDPAAAQGSRVTAMYLNGTAIDLAATYSVTVNSFLSTGGDNFTALNGAARKQDTGRTDLQAQVDYFAELAAGSAGLPVDYSQRAVGATFPAGAPASYVPGSDVTVNLSSLSMTAPTDVRDATVEVSLDGVTLGSFPVTSTIGTAVTDEVGTATAVVTLPVTVAPGAHVLVVTGTATGTVARVPVTVVKAATTVTGTSAPVAYGQQAQVAVTVTSPTGTPAGTVELYDGTTLLATTTLTGGTGTITVPAGLSVGEHPLRLEYLGNDGFEASTGSVTVTVTKAATEVAGTSEPISYGSAGSVVVTVASPAGTPTGTVELYDGTALVGSATLTGGTGTISIPTNTLSVGEHPLRLEYLGDASFAASTASVTVTVVKAATTIAGTSGQMIFGEAGTVQVTVTSAVGTPSGKVTVSEGDTELGSAFIGENGTATVTIPVGALTVGAHTLTLAYAGDDRFKPSSSTLAVTVFQSPSTVTGTSTSVTYGQPGAVEVTVASGGGTPTGTVQVKNGATVLDEVTLTNGTGTATIAALALEVGSHELSLEYLGNNVSAPAAGTVTVMVTKAAATVTASVSPAQATAHKTTNKVTVAVGAAGFTPTGTVQVRYAGRVVGTGTLANGSVAITVGPWATVGTLALTVSYLGDAHATAANDTVAVKVVKQAPTMKLAAPKTVKKNKAVTVTVTLTGVGAKVSGGKVTFTYNGKKVTKTVAANGKVSLKTAKLAKTTTVKVVYAGNATFSGATKSVKITVKK